VVAGRRLGGAHVMRFGVPRRPARAGTGRREGAGGTEGRRACGSGGRAGRCGGVPAGVPTCRDGGGGSRGISG
jgi:hypothetical protein